MTTVGLTDSMDPARAEALGATLGLASVSLYDLPPFFHQAYFWQARPPADLGRDGHPAPGKAGLLPDTGLPRRMWAGGRLAFHTPLCAGITAVKTSTLESRTRKQGRSGPLEFVTLRHEVTQAGALAVAEWQDIVYRQDPAPDAPPPATIPAPTDIAPQSHAFSTTLLFRYSALTFNGHRIHYDLDYAQQVEGYPGLVVHGPLLAQLLMLRAQAEMGQLATFRFRAVSPLFHSETAVSCYQDGRLWFRGPDGRLCLEAEATAA